MSEDVSLIVLDMIFSYWKTQMLRALATLSIADILAKGLRHWNLSPNRPAQTRTGWRGCCALRHRSAWLDIPTGATFPRPGLTCC